MVISLGWLSPATSCGLPAAQTTRAGSRCLLGLAPTGGCRAAPVTRRAVGSYPTFSPLPFALEKRAVCFLWPFPSPCGAQALPGSLPYGARTFLGAPVLPAHRDHRALPPPAGKATDRERAGASLAHQAPQQARQAVNGEPPAGGPRTPSRRHRGVGVEPEAVVLLEHRLAQPGRIPRREDRRRELGGMHGVDASRPVQPKQLPRGELGGEQQQGAIRHRDAAQLAER